MYYVFEREGRLPGRWVDDFPYLEGVNFTLGSRIARPVPQPIEVTLKRIRAGASDHGPTVPEFLNSDAPLFSNELITAMREVGIDNLDLYDAVLLDPMDGSSHTTHKAVNIIGAISAADMAKSDAVVHTGGPVIDVDFDRLSVDERKARGALIFRLAESTNAILVHDTVREHLLSKGFRNLAFYEPERVAL